MTAEVIDLQERAGERGMERLRLLTGLSPDEVAMIADRALPRHVNDRAVADFTRVCEQTGLIKELRKEPEPR